MQPPFRWSSVVASFVLAGIAACQTDGVGPREEVLTNASPTARTTAEGGAVWAVVLTEGPVGEVGPRASRLVSDEGLSMRKLFRRAFQGLTINNPDSATVANLRRRPDVRAVVRVDNVDVAVQGSQSSPPSWGLDRIDQFIGPLDATYYYGSSGSGVRIYELDSGIIDELSEFGGRASRGPDFIVPSTNSRDCLGHGTRVAALAMGSTYGVAKGATLIALRTVPCAGFGGGLDPVFDAIEWILEHGVLPAVVNMSIIATDYNWVLDLGVQAMIDAGFVVVAAAGNDGANHCTSASPTSVTAAIVVASSNQYDGRTAISNFGPCVDLFAPGEGVKSIDTSGVEVTAAGGTSVAAPHVSGAAAMYLQLNPTATPAQVSAALVNGTYPYVINYPGNYTTSRLLNVGFMYNATPLSVSIVGRGTVKLGSECVWRAVVSGGGSFVYRWKFSGGDFQFLAIDSVKTAPPNSGTLSVQVYTPGETYRGSASKSITVNTTTTPCPE